MNHRSSTGSYSLTSIEVISNEVGALIVHNFFLLVQKQSPELQR